MKTKVLRGAELLLILSLVLIFGGCEANTPGAVISPRYEITKWTDSTNSVSCYRFVGYDGISCVKEDLDFLPGGNLEKAIP